MGLYTMHAGNGLIRGSACRCSARRCVSLHALLVVVTLVLTFTLPLPFLHAATPGHDFANCELCKVLLSGAVALPLALGLLLVVPRAEPLRPPAPSGVRSAFVPSIAARSPPSA